MVPGNRTEIDESNAQFYGVWKKLGGKFANNEALELPGVTISWPGAKWPMLNVAGLSCPVADHAELEAKVAQAVGYANPKPVMGMVVACTEWLPRDSEGKNAAIFREHGLELGFTLRGMFADQLVPSRRTPPELEYRRATALETRRAFADLNAIGYNAPLEFGREVSDIDGFWDEAFAYVGYINGRPVTTAATYVEDNRLYVGWVATLPEARRNGYAEAVMRHSLDEAAWSSGLSRTVLHATELGYPIYGAMGYRQVAFFHVYFPQTIVNGMSNPG
jgi:ribosomal protein S18 acetylase RimI-like enzyme